jgi:general secretion pathway protein L
MATLILILGEKAGDPAPWGVFEKNTPRVGRVGMQNPGEKFSFSGDSIEHVWVVVPGTAVITRAVALPPQTERRARKAVGFMLEDDLAVDSEDLHFVLSPAQPGVDRAVSFVAHDAMRDWQSRLAAFGLQPDLMVPDYLAVPVAPGEVTVACWRDRALVRLGDSGTGFSIERDALAWVLEETLADTKAIRLMADNADAVVSRRALQDIACHEPLPDAKLLESAYAVLSGGANINLRQGVYAPRRDWRALGRAWRRAGALTGMAAAAALVFLIADGVRLNRHAEAALVRADAVFRETLPDVKRVVNPRAQIRTHLQDLKARTSTGFLQVSDMLFAAVTGINGAEIDALRFDAKRGEAVATVSLPSYDSMEVVKKAVAARGGLLQEGGARQDSDRIVADITVRLP